MNIKQTFLDLTKETYPHGTESEMFHLLPNNLEFDEFGNLFIQIGENPSTMFTSHLDTVSQEKRKIKHVIDGNIVKTDGTSILGADDKAGVTIMLYLIENKIPGLYYFFLGEERGCIGSKKLANKHQSQPIEYIKKVVSFDRRGTNSIITFQSGSRCCSEEFGRALSSQLNYKSSEQAETPFNYKLDPTGVYTDSYQFTSIYPECTNISVGYMNEHTHRETQDILHLEKLCKTVVLIDWDALPVKRDKTEVEYTNQDRYKDSYDFWDHNYTPLKRKEHTKNIWFIDTDYDNFISLIKTNESGKVIQVDLSPKRIEKERKCIEELIESLNVGAQQIEYDGLKLIVTHLVEYGGHQTEISREEITDYIEELGFWKIYIRE